MLFYMANHGHELVQISCMVVRVMGMVVCTNMVVHDYMPCIGSFLWLLMVLNQHSMVVHVVHCMQV